mgnify:FL=1
MEMINILSGGNSNVWFQNHADVLNQTSCLLYVSPYQGSRKMYT